MIRIRELLSQRGDDHRPNETGSALVIALVFLTLFGVLIAIVLSFAGTGFRYTLALRDQNDSIYGGDGGIEGAIDFLRFQLRAGRAGRPCPTFGPIQVEGVTVTVLCDGLDSSGDPTIPGFDETIPEQAILALTTSLNPSFAQTKNNVIRIKGDVWANNNFTQDPQSKLEVEGSVGVRGTCNRPQNITVMVDLVCGTTDRPDPNYPMLVTTPPPAANPLPTALLCNNPIQLVVTVPTGTYADASALNSLTASETCKNKLIWFQPGVYYFQSGDWKISQPKPTNNPDGKVDIVAGAPNGWDPATVNVVNRPSFGGSCKTETDFPTGPPTSPPYSGVQFIFGGNSSILINEKEVEICAQPSPRPPTSTAQQQISFFGVTQTAAGFSSLNTNNFFTASGEDSFLANFGTIYAPTSGVDIELNNLSAEAIRRGVISRFMRLSATGSTEFTGFPVSLPEGARANRRVLLRAMIDGKVRVRAVVEFDDGCQGDPDPKCPPQVGKGVHIQSWSYVGA